MSAEISQQGRAPRQATCRVVDLMRLAPTERERLWKGLERFVNCGDTLADFEALGRAFPSFWPTKTENWDDNLCKHVAYWDREAKRYINEEEMSALPPGRRIEEVIENPPLLDWNPAFHKWLLFYRNVLRAVWTRDDEVGGLDWEGRPEEFLMDFDHYNQQAITTELHRRSLYPAAVYPPSDALHAIWSEILKEFPHALAWSSTDIEVNWERGALEFTASNDFTRAFYLLCRQSWRARVCLRCKMFFIARTPKQIFCGTGCSAGSRLDSKLKWWNRVGAKRRTKQRQKASGKRRSERKPR